MKKIIAKLITMVLLILILSPAVSAKAAPTDASIASYVQTLIGKTYKAATQGPNSFDASGLVVYTFEKVADINFSSTLGRSCQKMYNTCKSNKLLIDEKKLQAGDLVFYGKTVSKISFMGIYIGKNKVVVCNSNRGVIISDLKAAGGKDLSLTAYADTSAILKKYQSTNTKVSIPSQVTNLKVNSSTENSITLGWKKVSGATSYTVYWCDDAKWTL